MKHKGTALLAAFLLLAFGLWTVFGFSFLLYPLGILPKPQIDPNAVALEGPTLFIADLHVAREEDSPRFLGLAEFISANHVRNLVIVGDLFDSPDDAWRLLGSSTGREASQAIRRVLGLGNGTVNLYFLRGTEMHDPRDLDLNLSEEPIFRTLGKYTRFTIDGVRVLATHGDEALGAGHGLLFSYLTGRPYMEALWKNAMGLDDAEWVIMGHSHMPGIDEARRVANPGGWTDLFGFSPPRGMGLLIAEGKVSLLQVKRSVSGV